MVRLRDVAERAGVSVATASYALRGHALVKPETRAKVLRVAEEMGYRPEVSAAVMAARRLARGRAVGRLSLGFVESAGTTHKHSEEFRSCAEARGYDVEWLRFLEGDDPDKVWRALWNRRVTGLYLAAPLSVPMSGGWVEGFDWSRFAVVKFSRSRTELCFDLIRHSAFGYMARAVREVAVRGYRRVAVILSDSDVEVDDEARLGAVLGWEALRKPKDFKLGWRKCSKRWLRDGERDEHLLRWLKAFGPDAVLGFPEGVYWRLLEAGFRMPEDFGFASVVTGSQRNDCAGCLDDHEEIAQRAVELLDRKIRLGQLGMVENPQESVIKPVWNEGKTLPSKVVKKAPNCEGRGHHQGSSAVSNGKKKEVF